MVVVIDCTDLDLGKHAYSQMKDFGVDPEVLYTNPLDVSHTISSKKSEEFLLMFNTDHRFAEQIVGKILDLEEDNHVMKVFVEKKSESQEVFEKRAKRLTREKAETLAEEVK